MSFHHLLLALVTVLVAFFLFSFPPKQKKLLVSELEETSAFDAAEYHGLREPYRSYTCLPRRVHLSQATDVNHESQVSMTVSFSLDYQQCKHVIPYVYYSTFDGKEKRATATPLHFNYTSSETKEYFESDWIYHVVLPNLLAETTYQYHIQVEKVALLDSLPEDVSNTHRRRLTQTVAHTPTLSFHTPPLPGSPTTIALVGDLGQTINSTLTMANIYRATIPFMTKHPIELVMIAGDLSYADSDPHRWTRWLDLMEPLFSKTPLAVAVGNHEIECDAVTHKPFVQYETYFRNPNRIHDADIEPIPKDLRHDCSTPSVFNGHFYYGNSFYAYTYGMMKMIVLNSYTHSHVASIQYKWLQQELEKKTDRSTTPWLVVTFHAPIYNTFSSHVNETQALEMQHAMEPLFVKHNVNLVISGHCHAYMRTHGVVYNKRVKNGPVYIIVGAGGNREGHSHGYQHDTPEEWIAKRDEQEFGYGRLHVRNKTHARWSWVRDGTTPKGVRDDVWIENYHHSSE